MFRLRYGINPGLLAVLYALAACGSATATLPAPENLPSEQGADPGSIDQPAYEEPSADEPEPEASEEASMDEEESGEAAEAGEVLTIESVDLDIVSDGQSYNSYLAAPADGGPYPGIVLVHSIGGLEEGYRTMTDRFAERGFVVLALGWQTFERNPPDAVVQQLVRDSVAYLTSRDDVDAERLGLTGFCAGGRYTMLLLPQIKEFDSGVAWYGFPYNGNPPPADFINDLDAPMLIVHGTNDSPSPIADIYRYTDALEAAGKDFQLDVYDGEPHGFMIQGGQLRTDEVGMQAFERMVAYFMQTLE